MITQRALTGRSLLVALLLLITTACFGPVDAGVSSVSAKLLFLGTAPFPSGWLAQPCTSTTSRCSEGEASVSFGRVTIAGTVLQQVYRLPSNKDAAAYYKHIYDVEFVPSPRPPIKPFVPPLEVAYRSMIADEYHLGCGVDKIPACNALFRYRNFVIEFYIPIDPGNGEGLRMNEVEPILRAMDARASAVLGIPLPTATP